MSLRDTLSSYWAAIQGELFPWLDDCLGPLTERHRDIVTVLEFVRLESFLPYWSGLPGRPLSERVALARAFVAKAVLNLPTTRALIERLQADKVLRRICGYAQAGAVPSESTFSRAFAEFSASALPTRVHEALVKRTHVDQLVGHISRDSTVRRPSSGKRKRGRPHKGEERPKETRRIERQLGMTIHEMLDDLPTTCDVGTKKNAKGYKVSWNGYKLHADVADGCIPISCFLNSASLHDSQVAIPLATMTAARVTSLYDLMDAAYDCTEIKDHSRSLGHVPIIDINPRTKERKEELVLENKALKNVGHQLSEDVRYNERTTAERFNGCLKEEFGGNTVNVRGNAKVMCHLMFGVLTLTVHQLIRFVT
ncbi:MAG: transposase [bacterium]